MSDVQITGLSTVLRHLDAYVLGTKANALAAAHEIAKVVSRYAYDHHLWQNRTGLTSRTTMGTVVDEAGSSIISIYISAGMDWDVFLELAHDGKWAWLWPAVEANVDTIRAILIKHLGDAVSGNVAGPIART